MCVVLIRPRKIKAGASSSNKTKNMEADRVALMQHFCLSKASTAFAKNIIEPLNH